MPVDPVVPAERAGDEHTRNEFSGVAHAVVQAGVITGGVIINATPANVVPVPRQLPPSVFGFVDRTDHIAELDALLATAAPGQPAPVVISAVSGTAGVGKTALVIHWAHRVRDQFPDGHLYVDLHGYGPHQPLQPAEVLDHFLRSLGLAGEDIPRELAGRITRFRTLVDQRQILIVLDNAGTVEQVRPLLPGTSSCFVVVTSRDALSGLVAREGARRIDLDLLTLADATALLRTLIGARIEGELDSAEALARLCARLPLALRIAAELVNARRGMRVSALVAELADERERLDLFDAGADTDTAVRSVFSWSYRHLPEPTARVFRLMGLLPGHDADVYAVSALADILPSTARKLVRDLVRAHLVEESAEGRCHMHDLLRVYAAEVAVRCEDRASRQAAHSRLFDHYLDSAAAALALVTSAEVQQPSGTATQASVPPWPDQNSAAAWLEAERPNLIAVVTAIGTDWPARTIRMSTTIAHYLNSYAYDSDALVLHTHALAAARSLDDRVEVGRAMNNLGITYRRLGQYHRALDHHQQALTIAAETGNQPEAGRALNNLGIIYRRLGQYHRALDHHQQALTIAAETGNQPEAGRALNDLGIIYRRLGQYHRALEHHQQALTIHRTIGNRVGEANALTSLGIAHRRLGQYRQALDHHQQALTIHRGIGNHVGEADALTRLGIVYERLKRGQDALDHFNKAVMIHRAMGNQPQEGRALNNLGIAHRKQGRHQEAREHLEQALAIHEAVGNRIDEGHALHALGVTYQQLEHYVEAVSYLERALDAHRATGNHVEQGHVLNSLGITQCRLGHHRQALDYHQQALRIAQETGNQELKTETLRNLGETSQATRSPDRALDHFEQALDSANKTGNRYEMARAHDSLACAYDDLGRSGDARHHWREALAGFIDLDVPEADDVRGRISALDNQEARTE